MIQKLITYLNSHFPQKIESIFLKGSQTRPETIDQWSDIDLLLIEKAHAKIDHQELITLFTQKGKIIGKEFFAGEAKSTLRLVILIDGMIQMIDLVIFSFQYWREQKIMKGENYRLLYGNNWLPGTQEQGHERHFQYDLKSADGIWFVFFLCINKFMRNDPLIGMHLLLKLLQEGLVLEMIRRDRELNTNFHRYGREEVLPEALNPVHLDYQNKKNVLLYIWNLGRWYDQRLRQENANYQERLSALDIYIEKSLFTLKFTDPGR